MQREGRKVLEIELARPSLTFVGPRARKQTEVLMSYVWIFKAIHQAYKLSNKIYFITWPWQMSLRNDLEGQVVMEGPRLPVRSTLERERAGLRATAFSSTPGIWGGVLTEACGHPIPHTQGFPTSLSNSHSHVTRWWEEQTLEMGCLGENVRVPGTQSRVS